MENQQKQKHKDEKTTQNKQTYTIVMKTHNKYTKNNKTTTKTTYEEKPPVLGFT